LEKYREGLKLHKKSEQTERGSKQRHSPNTRQWGNRANRKTERRRQSSYTEGQNVGGMRSTTRHVRAIGPKQAVEKKGTKCHVPSAGERKEKSFFYCVKTVGQGRGGSHGKEVGGILAQKKITAL